MRYEIVNVWMCERTIVSYELKNWAKYWWKCGICNCLPDKIVPYIEFFQSIIGIFNIHMQIEDQKQKYNLGIVLWPRLTE